MSGPAQVRSTPAIDALQVAVAKFHQRVQAALDALDGELYRAEDWLEHDRPSHWRKELHEAEDALHQAKQDLERCLLMTIAGERPACREQKAAVKTAQVRLAYCREKADVVKSWQRNFRHESLEFRGRIGQLRRALENDVPRARAVLVKILRRLEEYQIERPPETWIEDVASMSPAPISDAKRTVGGVSDADDGLAWIAKSASETPPTTSSESKSDTPPTVS